MEAKYKQRDAISPESLELCFRTLMTRYVNKLNVIESSVTIRRISNGERNVI